MFFCRQACEYVCFRTVGQGNECVSFFEPYVGEQLGISGIAVDNFTIGTFCREFVAPLQVGIDYAELEAVASHICESYGNLASPHDEHAAYAVADLTGQRKEVVDIFAGCCDVDDVAVLNEVVASGYDCLVVSFNGRNVEVVVGVCEVLEVHAGNFC